MQVAKKNARDTVQCCSQTPENDKISKNTVTQLDTLQEQGNLCRRASGSLKEVGVDFGVFVDFHLLLCC